MTAKEIIDIYLSFFEKRKHAKIAGSPLVPYNDPTTLFTSSGMQPLVPYLLGEKHPVGTRLVNIQNSFRAVDIDEVGDNRHTTFFRMLGNWSLGDYFKEEQLPWFWEFLTKQLNLNPAKLYATVFEGNKDIPRDQDSIAIWEKLFTDAGFNPKDHIFTYGVEKNWWSRSGTPDKMPVGEPGGPDSEVFYDFGEELKLHENSQWKNQPCHVNCDCGRYWEIGNSVFMQYKKTEQGFAQLPQRNVDFGGGLERLIGPTENKADVFMTSLFEPTIRIIEKQTATTYEEHKNAMQIIADHLGGSIFMAANNIIPSNKEQGYIMRRLIRRSLDNLYELKETVDIVPILEAIATQYRDTDTYLVDQFEQIKNTILEEAQKYERTRHEAKRFIEKKYRSIIPSKAEGSQSIKKSSSTTPSTNLPDPQSGSGSAQNDKDKTGDELFGTTEITADDAFLLYTTHGLSPTQIKSLGYTFNEQQFAQKMEEHQNLSRTKSAGKFKGGLADTQELTIKGHTATHLLHQAIRDLLGTDVHQSGSNITVERVRFDFNFDRKLTVEEIQKLEKIVNEKIKENLPVRFEIMPLAKAKEIGAIGLFDEKYDTEVKVYIMGGTGRIDDYHAYSKEFCGGPHVTHTNEIKSFTITKQEKLGQGLMRLYAVVA